MIKVCAWCLATPGKEVIQTIVEPIDDESITHGICEDHLGEMRKEILVKRAQVSLDHIDAPASRVSEP